MTEIARGTNLPRSISPRAAEMMKESSGSCRRWEPEPGDYLLGKIQHLTSFQERFNGARSVFRYELLVEEGTESGEPLTEEHLVVLGLHEELRRMQTRLDPAEGDTLCLLYLGRDDSDRQSRHLWRYTIEKHAADDDF